MITYQPEDYNQLSSFSSREWLETNGLGSFASSTIINLNTRRYHGLLVASLNPPRERYVLVSKLEETLIINGQFYELSTNQYPGTIYPQGFQYLKEFRIDPYPIFIYQVAGVEIRKSIFMIYGENSTVVQYQIRPSSTHQHVELQLRPLVAVRDYHCLTYENLQFNKQLHHDQQLTSITPYDGLPTIYFAQDADRIETQGVWYKNFEYEQEMQRGLDFTEDLYNPCTFIFDLNSRYSANIILSTKRHNIKRVDDYQKAELKRRREIMSLAPVENPFIRQLTLSSDHFVVKTKEAKTILAGYPWFSQWGRDALISLPGLLLVTGRIDVAKSVLLNFSKYVDCGMIPNYFSEVDGKPQYNSVDTTLWFLEALRSFLKYSGDYKFIKENFYDILVDIIAWHIKGTRFNIRVDQDSLLSSGQDGFALTWMDAKVADWVVTPRMGKPVEVQALWYNAVCFMEELADIFGDKEHHGQYHRLSLKIKESFNQQFFNEKTQCLYDCINGQEKDGTIRPNQIFTISLSHSLVDNVKAKKILETVERELLTDVGLRSLSFNDSQYKGQYQGDPWNRDSAYHQGTVWPWLLGPFLTAYLKTHGYSDESKAKAIVLLKRIENQLFDAGLGQLSEILDGNSPHLSRGCIAQAFSVAEILRAAVEDVYRVSFTSLVGKTIR